MNILYTNFHQGEGGGHTTYVMALCSDGRHNKFVACPASSVLYKKLQAQGFTNLIDLSFPSKFKEAKAVLHTVRRFRKVIREHSIDLVHTNGSQDNRIALYATPFNRKFRVVFTKHNAYAIKGLVSRWRFNHFNDAVIFVSRSIFDSVGFATRPGQIHLIENGVDLTHWRKQKALQTGHALRIVSTAGIALHKGWTDLVAAVASLPEEQKQRISITMPARLELPKEREAAQSRCDITFPGFSLDPREYLEDADVGFVLSRAGETISFACREMMSMDIPVIVSNFAGLPGNVDAGCGWVTPVSNVDALRDLLLTILAMTPEQINTMKVNARVKAESSFSIDIMREQTDRLYLSLMK